MRRRLALVLTLALCLCAPAAWAGGGNNVVKLDVHENGEVQKRSAMRVTVTGADTVDSTNLAQSYVHDCTDCEGVSSAFQAVIATGEPSNVSPTNAAVAVNHQCTRCKAFAYAYQYVVTTDKPFRLGDDDREAIRELRAEAAQLTRSDLPYPELDAKLQDVARRFRAEIDEALAEADVRGRDRDSDVRRDRDED